MKELVGYHIHLEGDRVVISDYVECRELSLSNNEAQELFDQLTRKFRMPILSSKRLSFLTRPIKEELRNSISHWVDRDWDVQLPSFGMSRGFEFQDVGPERVTRLEKSQAEYRLSGPFPQSEPLDGAVACSVPHEVPSNLNFHAIYRQRRSFRRYSDDSIDLQHFLNALGASTYRLARTASENSAEGHPKYSYGIGMNVVLAVFNVAGLQSGLYQYDKLSKNLVLLYSQDSDSLRNSFRKLSYGFKAADTACFTVVLMCDFRPYYWLYRHVREMRNIFIECGRIMQDFVFFGAHYGLNCVMTPAIHESVFYDCVLSRDHEVPIYLACFGKVGGPVDYR